MKMKMILDFIVEIVHHTVWPATVLLVLFVFRKHIVSLLQRIQRVGYGDKYADIIPVEIREEIVEKLTPVVTDEIDADACAWQPEVLKMLLVTGLSRIEKLVITRYYYDELTMKQIADTLDLTESTVIEIHKCVLKRLKRRLEKARKE